MNAAEYNVKWKQIWEYNDTYTSISDTFGNNTIVLASVIYIGMTTVAMIPQYVFLEDSRIPVRSTQPFLSRDAHPPHIPSRVR